MGKIYNFYLFVNFETTIWNIWHVLFKILPYWEKKIIQIPHSGPSNVDTFVTCEFPSDVSLYC